MISVIGKWRSNHRRKWRESHDKTFVPSLEGNQSTMEVWGIKEKLPREDKIDNNTWYIWISWEIFRILSYSWWKVELVIAIQKIRKCIGEGPVWQWTPARPTYLWQQSTSHTKNLSVLLFPTLKCKQTTKNHQTPEKRLYKR